MTRTSRILIIMAALLLSCTYYLPLWVIVLDAPQYPEGLGLHIYINEIDGQHEGDLQKINNLNHYIGMKTINPESIPELKIMPWIMRVVLLFGVVVGALGKVRLLWIWLILFAIVAVAGLVDYYLWGYDYGHNLDMENAIIKVPGMTYQPPLIGAKDLLNFRAVSMPASGGWIAIASFLIGVLILIFELRRKRGRSGAAIKSGHSRTSVVLAAFVTLAIVSCGNQGPVPIRYGEDHCDYCRMTIVDQGFGSELVTGKRKVFKFDSIECLAAFAIAREADFGGEPTLYVTDVNQPGRLLTHNTATFVHARELKSPMGVGLVAFGSPQDGSTFIDKDGGQVVEWGDVQKIVRAAWGINGQ